MENNISSSRSNRVWAGLFVVGIGFVLLMDRMGANLPFWLFRWPVILILIGTFLGLRHGFRGGAWLILIVIGSIFLTDMIVPGYSLRRYAWPILIMVFGLIMILKPKTNRNWGGPRSWKGNAFGNEPHPYETTPQSQFIPMEEEANPHVNSGDYLDSTAIFGGIKKSFFTKNFKGGEATSLFGGHEIDLSKSDIQGTVKLELTQIFGGTKLIVPNNWNIKSEVVAFLGGFEDKRHTDPTLIDPNKILLLNGTSIMGGIDVRSY